MDGIKKIIIGSIVGVAASSGLLVFKLHDTVTTCGEVLASDGEIAKESKMDQALYPSLMLDCKNSCPERTITFKHNGALIYGSGNWDAGKPVCKE